MKKYISILLLTIVCFGSCVKDLGNYDYSKISDFEIKDIEKQYSVTSFVENLVIQPTLVSEDNNLDYEYYWTLYYKEQGGYYKYKIDTISTEGKLDLALKYKPGSYDLQFKAINKKTGLAKFAVSVIEVTSPFSRAYYLLKETEQGDTEMDIHYDTKPTTKNAITEFYGKPLAGKPKALSYFTDFSYLNELTGERDINYLIMPMSESKMLTFSLSDMSQAREYNQWFFNATIDAKDIIYFSPGGYCYHFYFKNAAINNYQVPSYDLLSSGKISDIADLPEDGKSYTLSNIANQLGAGSLLFDTQNGRFLVYDYNGAMHIASMDGSQIKPGKINDELIFMGTTKMGDGLLGTALFKKADGSKYAYISDLTKIAYQFKYNITEKTDIDSKSKIFSANLISQNRNGAKYLYCVTDNNIYAVNYNTFEETKLSFEGLPSGEITFLDTMYSSFGEEGTPDNYNHLIVAVYSAGKYSIAFYNMVGGLPTGSPVKLLTGEGKIKKIQRATPDKVSGDLAKNYSLHY